jgi:hypothetical protein
MMLPYVYFFGIEGAVNYSIHCSYKVYNSIILFSNFNFSVINKNYDYVALYFLAVELLNYSIHRLYNV